MWPSLEICKSWSFFRKYLLPRACKSSVVAESRWQHRGHWRSPQSVLPPRDGSAFEVCLPWICAGGWPLPSLLIPRMLLCRGRKRLLSFANLFAVWFWKPFRHSSCRFCRDLCRRETKMPPTQQGLSAPSPRKDRFLQLQNDDVQMSKRCSIHFLSIAGRNWITLKNTFLSSKFQYIRHVQYSYMLELWGWWWFFLKSFFSENWADTILSVYPFSKGQSANRAVRIFCFLRGTSTFETKRRRSLFQGKNHQCEYNPSQDTEPRVSISHGG